MPRGPAVRNQITGGGGHARGPRVVVLTGEGERRSLPLVSSVTIGHDADACDLVVATAGVARRHARLIPLDDGVAVRDLRTRLGTFRNGRRLVSPERLEDGDVITVGDVELRYDASSRPRPRPRHRPPSAEQAVEGPAPARDAGAPDTVAPGAGG
ncbi:MAG: FHA domain-containing protein, partial [Acidimicrobiia bacterium]|nr:FHA domain-containing protein [Acidimicrobiia bacterium]